MSGFDDPILFLDFDGVLNSTAWYERRPHRGNRPYDELDPKAVARLVMIVALSGCQVVVSSTWRRLYSIHELVVALRQVCGIDLPLISATPDGIEKAGSLRRAQRGAEIQAWRWMYCHTGPFAVLDDDTDMDDVLDHFVQTQFATGLLDEHVAECVALLAADCAIQEAKARQC